MSEQREQGRVKVFFGEKGYGFIRTDAGDDLFFHVSACGFLEPAAGDRVAFDRGPNPRTGKIEGKSVSILN
jgi:cold shock CspA family protein